MTPLMKLVVISAIECTMFYGLFGVVKIQKFVSNSGIKGTSNAASRLKATRCAIKASNQPGNQRFFLDEMGQCNIFLGDSPNNHHFYKASPGNISPAPQNVSITESLTATAQSPSTTDFKQETSTHTYSQFQPSSSLGSSTEAVGGLGDATSEEHLSVATDGPSSTLPVTVTPSLTARKETTLAEPSAITESQTSSTKFSTLETAVKSTTTTIVSEYAVTPFTTLAEPSVTESQTSSTKFSTLETAAKSTTTATVSGYGVTSITSATEYESDTPSTSSVKYESDAPSTASVKFDSDTPTVTSEGAIMMTSLDTTHAFDYPTVVDAVSMTTKAETLSVPSSKTTQRNSESTIADTSKSITTSETLSSTEIQEASSASPFTIESYNATLSSLHNHTISTTRNSGMTTRTPSSKIQSSGSAPVTLSATEYNSQFPVTSAKSKPLSHPEMTTNVPLDPTTKKVTNTFTSSNIAITTSPESVTEVITEIDSPSTIQVSDATTQQTTLSPTTSQIVSDTQNTQVSHHLTPSTLSESSTATESLDIQTTGASVSSENSLGTFNLCIDSSTETETSTEPLAITELTETTTYSTEYPPTIFTASSTAPRTTANSLADTELKSSTEPSTATMVESSPVTTTKEASATSVNTNNVAVTTTSFTTTKIGPTTTPFPTTLVAYSRLCVSDQSTSTSPTTIVTSLATASPELPFDEDYARVAMEGSLRALDKTVAGHSKSHQWNVHSNCLRLHVVEPSRTIETKFVFQAGIPNPVKSIALKIYNCGPSSEFTNGKCVYLLKSNHPITFIQAERQCEAIGGTLLELPMGLYRAQFKVLMENKGVDSAWITECQFISAHNYETYSNGCETFTKGSACTLPGIPLCSTPYNNDRKCFKFIDYPLNYYEAKLRCEELGLQLATVSDHAEAQIISNIGHSVRLGFYNNGTWFDSRDQMVSDFNLFPGGEWPAETVTLSIIQDGLKWIAVYPSTEFPFVCQYQETTRTSITMKFSSSPDLVIKDENHEEFIKDSSCYYHEELSNPVISTASLIELKQTDVSTTQYDVKHLMYCYAVSPN